jgi:hypothetical protein
MADHEPYVSPSQAPAELTARSLIDVVGLSHALSGFATSNLVPLVIFGLLGHGLYRVGLRRAQ